MPEAVKSSDETASQSRLVAALPDLFADLRRADFDVGTEQYLAACDLLVSFNASRRTPSTDELRASLSSVFCTSAAEQARFPEVFTPWYRRLISSSLPPPPDDRKRPPTWAVTSPNERKYTWIGAIALCFLIAGVVVYVNWPAPEREVEKSRVTTPVEPPPETKQTQILIPRQPPEPVIPPPEYTPRWVNPARWLWFIPVLSWLAWILSRLFLRQVVLKRRRRRPGEEIRLDYLPLAGDKGELFSAHTLAETWRHLRRFRSMRSQRLNEAATIDRTLESGGYFRPVYRERQVPPAYLFLVDRRHGEDHVAAIAGELGGALRRENIQVSSFDYYEDPRYCTPVGEIASERGPAALAGVYGDRDLIFAGDGEALFDQETGAPQPWLEEFSSFEDKYMLTTQPVWRQSHRFDAITKAGFRLLPLTPAGLSQLGTAKDEIGYDDPRDIPVPRRFAINPGHWLEERSPKRGSMQVLLRELREYMGQEGFLLLTATAAYPGIYWRLTRALDAQLGLSANDRTLRLRKLARLPWYRHGRMPDYFRVALLRALDRDSFRRVSDTYNALIEHRNDDQLRLPVAVPDWQKMRTELREMAQSSERHEPLGDQVFAEVVRGRKPRLLEFALPNRFAPPLDRRRWSGLVLPLLGGLFILPAVVWLNLWAWQSWFEPTARSQSLTRMQEQHYGVRVRVVSTERLRPIADALKTALSSWGFQTQGASATAKPQQPAQQGLAGRLKTTEQAIVRPEAVGGPNLVIYAPGNEALAELIRARVTYLYYGVEPQLEQNKNQLPPDTEILVELRAIPRGFRDPLKIGGQTASYYVSKQGVDANTCTQAQSVSTPKLTISSGASCLKPGDTLFVKAGLYAEQLSNIIPSGTSWDSPVTVAAFSGDVVTIQPATGASGALSFGGENQAYIVIDGMVVDCVNASTHCVSIQQGAHHIKIKNSELKNSPGSGVLGGRNSEFSNLNVHHHKGRGFQFNQPNNVIESSEIHNNGGSGILLQGTPPNNNKTIVRSNQIHTNNTTGSDTSGVMVGSGTDILVYNNIIYSQSDGADGIEVNYNAINAQLYNNTIYNNPGYGIVVGDSNVSGTGIKNNVISSNVKGAINDSGTGTTLANNLTK